MREDSGSRGVRRVGLTETKVALGRLISSAPIRRPTAGRPGSSFPEGGKRVTLIHSYSRESGPPGSKVCADAGPQVRRECVERVYRFGVSRQCGSGPRSVDEYPRGHRHRSRPSVWRNRQSAVDPQLPAEHGVICPQVYTSGTTGCSRGFGSPSPYSAQLTSGKLGCVADSGREPGYDATVPCRWIG
jgi:hypothetical protein